MNTPFMQPSHTDTIEPMNIPIQHWINARLSPEPERKWVGAGWGQVSFVRDSLQRLMGFELGFDAYEKTTICTVISEHRSKSTILPVYSLWRKDVGLRIVLRDNFYNWKMSVISDRAVNTYLDDLFFCQPPREPEYGGNCLDPVYFEGFPPELIFGYYGPSDKKKWSAEVSSDYQLYTAIWLILRALGHTVTRRQYTQEEHKAVLDKRYSR